MKPKSICYGMHKTLGLGLFFFFSCISFAKDISSAQNWRSYQGTQFPEVGWSQISQGRCLKLSSQGGGGDLVSVDEYEDFELELDWRISPAGNSGILYRVSEEEQYAWMTGLEMQVLDDQLHPDGKEPKTSASALYSLIAANSFKQTKNVGEFNHVKIIVKGPHIEHWLNGIKVVETNLWTPAWEFLVKNSKFHSYPNFGNNRKGRIALQDHGDEVEFCNIKINTFRF